VIFFALRTVNFIVLGLVLPCLDQTFVSEGEVKTSLFSVHYEQFIDGFIPPVEVRAMGFRDQARSHMDHGRDLS